MHPQSRGHNSFYSSLSRRLPDTCISFPSPSIIFPTIPPTLTLIPRHSPPSLRHHPPYLHLHPHHHAHLHLHHLQGRNFRGKMRGAGLVSWIRMLWSLWWFPGWWWVSWSLIWRRKWKILGDGSGKGNEIKERKWHVKLVRVCCGSGSAGKDCLLLEATNLAWRRN